MDSPSASRGCPAAPSAEGPGALSVVPVRLGPEHGTGYLTPADEMDEIELGERADLWLTLEQLALVYGRGEERARSMALYLRRSIAGASGPAGSRVSADET